MGLLVSFFVMLVAFSNQDHKSCKIVAGSMRDAFGVQNNVRYSGIIEVRRPADAAEAEERRAYPARGRLRYADAGRAGANDRDYGAKLKSDRAFALASASLRQALQDMPELTEVSKHIMVEETKEGLNHRNRRPGRPLDVRRKAPRSLTSAPGG